MCNACYEYGTEERDVLRTLRQVMNKRISVRYRKRPTFASVIGHLRLNGSILLLYWRKVPGYKNVVEGHYIFMISAGKGKVLLINDIRGSTTLIVDYADIKKKVSFRSRDKYFYPFACYIKKAK